VLLNVHPDYVDFDGHTDSSRYPIARYQELLSYVRRSYDGLIWHPLPRELAAYCADFRPKHPRQPLNNSPSRQQALLSSPSLTLSSLLWAMGNSWQHPGI
jgi:hypothetical protein